MKRHETKQSTRYHSHGKDHADCKSHESPDAAMMHPDDRCMKHAHFVKGTTSDRGGLDLDNDPIQPDPHKRQPKH